MIEIDRSDRKRQARRDIRRLKNVDDLTRLVAERVIDQELQEKTLDAIDDAFEKLMGLFRDGGIISGTGKILDKDISDKIFSSQALKSKYHQIEEGFDITTAHDVRQFANIDIDSLGLASQTTLFRLKKGFEQSLSSSYSKSGGVQTVKYKGRHDGNIESLARACAKSLDLNCQQKGLEIKDVVSPVVAVRSLMITIAERWGEGRKG